ncbi:hypothetical protein BDV96DRAFT_595583 [Lophiotrema nucula]|uniref:Uncharacterized protein n=1 Tax=Lophiotrema nucula TaxID=690887 RepID=A0A6A5ZP24_9PLEO|nr:hypothetical protein BDV96DRAFT_595583 [Lophiotrema nucula]
MKDLHERTAAFHCLALRQRPLEREWSASFEGEKSTQSERATQGGQYLSYFNRFFFYSSPHHKLSLRPITPMLITTEGDRNGKFHYRLLQRTSRPCLRAIDKTDVNAVTQGVVALCSLEGNQDQDWLVLLEQITYASYEPKNYKDAITGRVSTL